MSTSQQIWLITGASSGFGTEFVKQAIKRGDKAIATARSLTKIQHLTELGAEILELDIRASQAELDAKALEAIGIYGRIDILVNNAAYVNLGTLEEMRYIVFLFFWVVENAKLMIGGFFWGDGHEELLAQFHTNVFGTMNMTRSFLPHFRARKSGTFVFIGSIAAWQGFAAIGAYCASKFALRGLVESLTLELAPLNLKTLLVEPGYFLTSLLNPGKAIYTNPKIDDYKDLTDDVYATMNATNGKQRGDVVKGVKKILDVVKREGEAEGREWTDTLVLGDDAVDAVRAKCEGMLERLEEWEGVSRGTDF